MTKSFRLIAVLIAIGLIATTATPADARGGRHSNDAATAAIIGLGVGLLGGAYIASQQPSYSYATPRSYYAPAPSYYAPPPRAYYVPSPTYYGPPPIHYHHRGYGYGHGYGWR